MDTLQYNTHVTTTTPKRLTEFVILTKLSFDENQHKTEQKYR